MPRINGFIIQKIPGFFKIPKVTWKFSIENIDKQGNGGDIL